MIMKFLSRENFDNSLVELDNIALSISILAECFVARYVLQSNYEVLKNNEDDCYPLMLINEVKSNTKENTHAIGAIVDSRHRTISTMEIKLVNGRVYDYKISIVGIYCGKKYEKRAAISFDNHNRPCSLVELTDTMNAVVDSW